MLEKFFSNQLSVVVLLLSVGVSCDVSGVDGGGVYVLPSLCISLYITWRLSNGARKCWYTCIQEPASCRICDSTWSCA